MAASPLTSKTMKSQVGALEKDQTKSEKRSRSLGRYHQLYSAETFSSMARRSSSIGGNAESRKPPSLPSSRETSPTGRGRGMYHQSMNKTARARSLSRTPRTRNSEIEERNELRGRYVSRRDESEKENARSASVPPRISKKFKGSQIENEYGMVEPAYGAPGTSCAHWAANMAVGMQTGVPWTMCKQQDAPSSIINTCNGMYCTDFTKLSQTKPKLWTENWTGWFLEFGGKTPQRPVEDIAFAIARFVINGGTFVNYYMYHGGTTFGRAAGAFVAPSYDYDAPIDEYGVIRQQEWGHLRDLHIALRHCSNALLHGKLSHFFVGTSQEAYIFKGNNGQCAPFQSNVDQTKDVVVKFQNKRYYLPAWSVSILPDCKNVVFNTAKVNWQTNVLALSHWNLESKELQNKGIKSDSGWQLFKEIIGISSADHFKQNGLVDHVSKTKDTTDYLWYTISVNIDKSESFLGSNSQLVLEVESLGHGIVAFVNGIYIGGVQGRRKEPGSKLQKSINLHPGVNHIALLSMTVGLRVSSGPFYERRGTGISKVAIHGLKTGMKDLSNDLWTYQVGLTGEKKELFKQSGQKNVLWGSFESNFQSQPMTWYKWKRLTYLWISNIGHALQIMRSVL